MGLLALSDRHRAILDLFDAAGEEISPFAIDDTWRELCAAGLLESRRSPHNFVLTEQGLVAKQAAGRAPGRKEP